MATSSANPPRGQRLVLNMRPKAVLRAFFAFTNNDPLGSARTNTCTTCSGATLSFLNNPGDTHFASISTLRSFDRLLVSLMIPPQTRGTCLQLLTPEMFFVQKRLLCVVQVL